jgi:hypothetical protein
MGERLPVRTALLTGIRLSACTIVVCSAAWAAEGSISVGFSDFSKFVPNIGFNFNDDWTIDDLNMTGKATGNVQFDKGIRDATTLVEWHADKALKPSLNLELDASYNFMRDVDDTVNVTAIEQSHTTTSDIGLEKTFDEFILKNDVGVDYTYFENDSGEDFYGGYLSTRMTLWPSSTTRPFVEAAYVRRNYVSSDGDGFAGPDLVVGLTFEQKTLNGDLGVYMARRTTQSGQSLHVFGPYAEVKWTPSDIWSFNLDLTTGIEQDTIMQSELFRFYEGKLQAVYTTERDIKLSALVDASLEDHDGMREASIAPKLRVEWQHRTGLNTFAGVGLAFTKKDGEDFKHEPSVEVGLKMVF